MWDVRLTHSEFLASIVQRGHGIAFLLTLWLLILLNGVTMTKTQARSTKMIEFAVKFV